MIFAALILAALDLGEVFSSPEAWQDSADMFAVEHRQEGFRFASEARDVVNSLDADACVWRGHKIFETRVFFDKSGEEERVSRLELSLFNRGDAKGEKMTTESLQALLDELSKEFAPGTKRFKDEKTTLRNNALQYRRVLKSGAKKAELVWAITPKDRDGKRYVDFLRLTVHGEMPGAKADVKRVAKSAAKPKIIANVTKSPNGDVFIDNVPMVDQGQKGYCAAAVSERVLRYYGFQIDEHEIALQAGTTSEGGTSVSAMKETIERIGGKNGLGFSEIVSMNEGGIAGLEEEIKAYNKAAKAEKKPEISLAQFTRGNMIYTGEMREAMNPKVLHRMRLKDSRSKKFSRLIRQQVSLGIPVFWGVTLGIYPERGVNPQTSGGHMRLIIGYNDKKKEILYTDTWGEGHELKRMPEDWAFTITHDAFYLKPL